MNELLTTMSTDMGIKRYQGESDDSFIYRICYSAMGQWCLQTAQNSYDGIIGTTKHHQTIVINELLQHFVKLFPSTVDKYINASKPHIIFPVHIRRVYEETGYLLTNNNNCNQLADFGRSSYIGSTSLFFGFPKNRAAFTVNGLGVFSTPTTYSVVTTDLLIRDALSCEDYLLTSYNVGEYCEKDIAIEELQFFDPISKSVPSKSWSAKMTTEYSVARKSEFGPYYKVIQESDDCLLFAEQIVDPQSDGFTSYEYRRLYYVLKAHYNNPVIARIHKQDEEYSKLIIGGHLPNREYYFLLLVSWPINNAFDKVSFLIKNEFIPEITSILKNIGVEVKGGCAVA